MNKSVRLFHVSEESDITVFHPRVPKRRDLDPARPLVWAISEDRLVNFLTPRDCPRVCFHKTASSKEEDLALFTDDSVKACVSIESIWLEKLITTTLYLYEFDPANFYLQDECAGYYVSERSEYPISVTRITDLQKEISKRNCEFRIYENLWPIADRVTSTSLDWSLCRMKNALARP